MPWKSTLYNYECAACRHGFGSRKRLPAAERRCDQCGKPMQLLKCAHDGEIRQFKGTADHYCAKCGAGVVFVE